MNILITGCAGFIGSSLTDKLIQDNHIIGIDILDSYYSPEIKENNMQSFINNSNFQFYKGDIRNKDVLDEIFKNNKIDAVVHLAARAGVRASFENTVEYTSVNIEGTLNILNVMNKYNVKKLVFASSSSVYGNCNEEKFGEDIKNLKQISPYAMTKKTCEECIELYCNQFDIHAVVLRFFTVFGPRQRPDLAIHKFVKLIKEDKPITLYGDGTTYRDYTYIDNIISGIISAIKYDKTPFEIINLGSSSPVTLNEIIKCIEKELGKKAIIEHLPMQNGDVEKTYADISKAKKLLNYNPEISFTEGIHRFIKTLT